jgi:hypothetical protein
MGIESNEALRRQLYESRDFIQLARLGHELSDAGFDDAGTVGPVEANFRCRFCGDEIRFRDLAWGLVPQPLWVVAEISGGDPNEDCWARRARRLGQKRVVQTKLLARWRRLRWTATNRENFN